MPKRPKPLKIEEDAVVSAIVDDPSSVPNARLVVGLLGRGDSENTWRIYFSSELHDFIEVDESHILHTMSLRTPENPLGGTAVWVDSDAELTVVRSKRKADEAEFLRGSISARMLSSSSISGFSVGGLGNLGVGIRSIPPVESCVPALCLPPPSPPDPPGTTAVCTLATNCT